MSDQAAAHVALTPLDWVALAGFLAVVIAMAIWVKLQQRGSEDFFLAGRSMGWFVVTCSTFATLFSTISFVAVPGEAYGNGLLLSIVLVAGVAAFPLGIWLFLRFFFLAPTFTAYEYLERRFHLPARLTGAGIYCAVRLMYAGTVFYAAAQIFEALIGWPPLWTIGVVGLFTIVYTATGGMKAVMLTDTVQGVVVVIGIGAILFHLLAGAGFDAAAVYRYAVEHDRGFSALGEPSFYTLDLKARVSIYVIVLSALLTPLVSLSADQSVVQRLLSAKGYDEAKRAVWINALVSVPIVGMLWFIGIALFHHYRGGEALPPGIRADQVMGYFITTELPPPLPGLISAALLAALMSTIDSTVNCVANVVHRDWLIRLGVTREGAPNEMAICRGLSVGAGAFGVLLAVVLTKAGEGVSSSVLEIAGIWSSLWGVLLMAFVLGVAVPRVSGRAMTTGLLAGGVINLYLPYALYYAVPAEERISFMWIGVPGMIVAAVVPLLLSVVWPEGRSLDGLTLRTAGGRDRSAREVRPTPEALPEAAS